MKGNKTIRFFILLVANSHLLSGKEKEILTLRLNEETLKRIGKKKKVTGERVRQIEKKAIEKMKYNSNQQVLF